GGNLQQPIKVVSVAFRAPKLAHLLDTAHDLACRLRRIADDDLVALLRRLTERRADELIDLAKVLGGRGRTREYDGERLIGIRRVEQQAEQVQNFFRGAGTAGKYDDGVRRADDRFEPLFDVRHDHELIHDRIGRFGRDDAGLGDADVPAI